MRMSGENGKNLEKSYSIMLPIIQFVKLKSGEVINRILAKDTKCIT
jgi:hypothetical protein